ncbi:RimK/LysX family protein [Sulfurimonas sp. HSL-3221]|uniref:ATP-dependent zinc protease family protein n=1 Tax=Sulfurimonadaceae TaxID=2771471 RepID=UPI001E411189|nr:RimK/LysX family protein [Sulfurimonas sp. HSL-3221]UFS63685.1 RimK/LysX family protein [Sulfurimonas sp. HSL-3221]
MKKRTFLAILCLVAFSALAAVETAAQQPPVVETPAEVSWSDEEADAGEIGTKQVIGKVEKVFVEPGGFVLDGRIDTGANTTSIGAEELQIINEDGQDWALFNVNGKPIRAKVVRFVKIKQHGAPSQRRAVVMLKLTLSDVTQAVEVTLTDRSNFKYKILIGVNFLHDHFIVDVSRKYIKELVETP